MRLEDVHRHADQKQQHGREGGGAPPTMAPVLETPEGGYALLLKGSVP